MGASSRRRALPCGSSGDLDKSETLCYAESAGQVAVVTGDGSRAFTRCPVRPDHRHGRRAAHPVLLGETDRPGGNVVLPWANSYAGLLVALTVSSNGDASCSIVAESSFMLLRDQRERRGPVAAVVGYDEARAEANTTACTRTGSPETRAHKSLSGYRVPQCQWRYGPYGEKDRVGVLWLLDPDSRAWTQLTYITPDANERVPGAPLGPSTAVG